MIAQFDKNKSLLDPFCGSGTILYEGAMNGLNSIGVELNPIGQVLSEGKININKSLNEEIEEINRQIANEVKVGLIQDPLEDLEGDNDE